jgi:ketosteroid isomerase-like protein
VISQAAGTARGTTVNDSGDPIAKVFDAYKIAVFDKNVEDFMALFAPAVQVYDSWAAWVHDGAAAWRKVVEGWFGSLGTERVGVLFDDVHITLAGDVAFAHAIVTFQALAADGTVARAMQNRLTWALRQIDGAWKIVHEHTSAPADFETGKVILQRAR